MSDEASRSVTHWIGSLKLGDADADAALWRRYFEALVRLARARLGGAPQPSPGNAKRNPVISRGHLKMNGCVRSIMPADLLILDRALDAR
jgi:hypothetical protein